MKDAVNLVNESIHSRFSNHLRCCLLSSISINFQESPQFDKSDVSVQFGQRKQVVFDNGSLKDC